MGCKKTENESEFTLFVNSECGKSIIVVSN